MYQTTKEVLKEVDTATTIKATQNPETPSKFYSYNIFQAQY